MSQVASLEIQYCTTNKREKPYISFQEALLLGQAPLPDGGLFMPTRIPRLSDRELFALIPRIKKQPYWKIAFEVLRLWFSQTEISDDDLRDLVKRAYTFNPEFETINQSVHIMRLDTGPTFSFKDYAMRLLALLFRYFKAKMTLLTATSGDTGSAFTDAFRESDGSNILAMAIQGTFDECQNLVRRAFADPELSYLCLSSANSINIGRLLPQIVYYFYAFAHLVDDIKKMVFSVPSGNFGNMMGVIFAREMGLPIEKIVVATNANDEFPLFWSTGRYSPIIPSRNCDSNAMNVGNPSNLRRLIHMYDGHLSNDGVLLQVPNMEKLRKDIFATSISDRDTWAAVKRVYYLSDNACVLEPHGAVAFAGLDLARKLMHYSQDSVHVLLETAHPAKFVDTMQEKADITIELPEALQRLLQGVEKYTVLEKTGNEDSMYEALKRYIQSSFDSPDGIQGLVLFPLNEVSELQRRQMTVY